MTYAVKEVFLTLQGEGINAGRAAVFLRFAGCNLWSGREEDRGRGKGGCSTWCDTDFRGGDRVDLPTLVDRVLEQSRGVRFVVITGGEPLLQLDAKLINSLRLLGFEIAVETNGTVVAPVGIDWLCVSPKVGGELVQDSGDELKLVLPQVGFDPMDFEHLAFAHFLLQPMDGLARKRNALDAAAYCMLNPKWRLSTQTHKFLELP